MTASSHPMAYGALDSIAAPTHGFVFTPTDNTDILDPNRLSGDQKVLVRAVTTTIDGTIVVKYHGSLATVAVPMLAGVRRSMQITKILSTGTTAGITSAGVVCEY